MLRPCSAMEQKTKVLHEPQVDWGMKEAQLVLFNNGYPQKNYGLVKPRITIGSAPDNDIVIADPYVSKHHASIEKRDQLYFLVDQNSTNGTFLNKLLIKETSLQHKSSVQLGKAQLQFEYLHYGIPKTSFYEGMISQHPTLMQVFQMIEKIAHLRETVIIYGETGTGKELIAKAIHARGQRSKKPWIVLNCGAIPAELLESELFGHIKGAFTGAHQDRIGVFQAAEGGTLFLDEIGELPLSLQPKLLRVLESKEVRPIGATRSVHVDVRIVAATHRDLSSMVKKDKFREDLFYRLHLIPIHLPPLRNRREDIHLLVKHFLKDIQITSKGLKLLLQHVWPGNIRELKNVLERLKLLKEGGMITEQDVQNILGTKPVPLAETIQQIERNLIQEFLEKNQWNRTRTARLLSMAKTTLLDKMKKYGLEKPGR